MQSLQKMIGQTNLILVGKNVKFPEYADCSILIYVSALREYYVISVRWITIRRHLFCINFEPTKFRGSL